MEQQRYLRIIGSGHYLPENVVTNKDVEALCDTTDEWITERSGIKRRHFCAEDEGNTDMAAAAGQAAIEAAGIQPTDIDGIIVGTCSPDYAAPSVATLIQHRLGIPHCMAFDVNAACTGFIYALTVAEQFIASGRCERLLVVGSERLSSFLDWSDRSTAVLFGDAAGAVVVEASDQPGLVNAQLFADGSKESILWLSGGKPVYADQAMANRIHMDGRAVFRAAVNAISNAIDECLAKAGISQNDIDWLIPHQANIRIIQAVARKLKLPMNQVVVTVDETANSSAATIPTALDIAIRDERIQRGQWVLCAAFGAGLTWGACVFRY